MTDLDINRIEIDNEEDDKSTSPSAPIQNLKWADEDVTSSLAHQFEEKESLTTQIDPLNFRKASHFNGRPFASWGSLFPPLYASHIMPLAPLTQKLWWQIARDMVPSDSNTTGKINKNMMAKVKVALKPHIDGQVWTEEVKSQVAKVRTSSMNESQLREMRRRLQQGYLTKFPSSSAMYETKFYNYVKGEYVPRSIFNEENHQRYGARSDTNKRVK